MNDRQRLTFERVEIRRMPGIETGFAVDGLCGGINVICGPNASGKTSLTMAVRTLLWPRASSHSRSVLDGTFNLDGRLWRIGYDSGSPRWQCDGLDSDAPSFDTADERDRYLLALHDLLRADNRGFAEAILRESTGGFDVGQAAAGLGFTPKPSVSTSLKQRLDHARDDVREASRAQDALRQQEREREQLLLQQERAREAGHRVRAIERALDYRRAVVARDETHRTLSMYPASIAALTGHELDELQRLRQRHTEAAAAVDAERMAIGRARSRQAATGLTARLPVGLISRLRTLCADLQGHDMNVRSASDRRIAAEEIVASARAAIGSEVDDAHLEALDIVQFNALAELMDESQKAHSWLDSLTAIAQWIPPSPDNAQGVERDRLTVGIQCLTSWLRETRDQPLVVAATSGPSRALLLGAAAFAIVEALLLGALAHPSLFILLVPGIVLIVLALRQSPQAHAGALASAGVSWQREYERLGLEAPARWEPEVVAALIGELARRSGALQAAEDTRQRWRYVHDDRPAVMQQVAEIDARVASFCQKFGIPAVNDVAALHRLANAISTWQTERHQVAAATARLADAQARYDAVLRTINSVLEPYGYQPVLGHTDATSAIDHLSGREQEWIEAASAEEESRQRLNDQANPQLERSRDDLNAFFERCGVAPDDEVGLRQLVEQVADYQAAKRADDRAALEAERAADALGDAKALAEMSVAELEAERLAAQEQFDRLEEIGQQIATIDALIDRAKRGHDLEAALAAVRVATDNLREGREANEALVAGWTLAEFVQRQTRDVDRPRVFHRARELFARITQGRYELDVDSAEPPHFRARDATTGVGHTLDELSSGTRLQLLLAVRVAFVEQQERGPMLPLILDETLGNSDEHRARAIIDATVQIAREGRQVFYLTAQHDEVRKWESIMAEHDDVPFALVDLARVRGLADWERLPPAEPQAWPMPAVPAPNGHDRDQYGLLLHVPGIDLSAADTGGIHLWHLVDDLTALHRLLSIPIETWGQLRTLTEYGGIALLADMPGLFDRCRARVQVIATIAEAWRIGRGRPVDRQVLVDSGAVTSNFIDRVAQLAESLDGDAVALVEALENGEVARFRTASCADLKDYLVEHGYIDLTPPLSINDVHARVLASSASDLAANVVTPDWINTTLSTLWQADSSQRLTVDASSVAAGSGLAGP